MDGIASSAAVPGEASSGAINAATVGLGASDDPAAVRLRAVMVAARHHGIDLDLREFRPASGEVSPSPASLVAWATDGGMAAKAVRLRWRQLFRLGDNSAGAVAPVVLLLKDGSAALLVGSDAKHNVVWLRDPRAEASVEPVAVDELRLTGLWGGEAVLLRRRRGEAEGDARFDFGFLMRVVGRDRGLLRDVAAASVTLSVLTILPPLLVMTVIDRVVAHHSLSTLVLIASILGVAAAYETLLGYGRRELVQVVSARVDSRLNVHVFSRLLSLPLDYFEKHQAGQTTYRLAQVGKVREFLTGKLMGTFLDLITLVVLLPVLFWMYSTLAWMVLVAAGLISVVVMAFLPAMRRIMGKVQAAEAEKGSVLVETVYGVRTVKSLALEPQRRAEWDERAAHAGELRLQAGRLANWPQTIITPIERFIDRGVIMVGAWFALNDNTGIAVGALVAFMLLGGRVTQPLVGLARLMEDLEDARAALTEVGSVLNNPTESAAMTGGLRPRFEGALSFEDVSFSYPGSSTKALERVSFQVPAGTMLGVVGRSGSGKSTLTRLLQGINREYSGFVKLDGTDLREVNLTHLRRSFGVVLQDNFLFRGSIRDNITAGRPGLALDDVIRAARLAGAEEFIERMPQGYDTHVAEGSANLSGGQRQRLAIARALIVDPRLMILDEATSALDPESEALVNANLTRMGKGRTMVIVSHRLSSLVDCDQILVMERGTVADCAPHKVLLERCGIYRQLWTQQNRHLDPQGARQALLAPVAVPSELRAGE